MIRYEIVTKPGLIMDATLIKKVVTTMPKKSPTIIVYVAVDDHKAFEKQIEGDLRVLSYHADPRASGTMIQDWTRK